MHVRLTFIPPLAGGVFAVACVLLLSLMHADPGMRRGSILALVAVAGAIGGAVAIRILAGGRPGPTRNALTALTYGSIVFIGFVLARLGPF